MEADDISVIINNNTNSNNGSGRPKRKPTTPIDPLSVTESLGFQTFRRESRRPWTKEEDDQLTKIMIELHPGANEGTPSMLSGDEVKWDVVASFFAETSQRKAKDCRKRWCNSLDPNLRKGKWTPEEDAQLLSAFQKYGAAWKKVASTISGRTDDQCAKRYIEVLDPKTKDRLKPWTHEEDLLLIRRVKIHGTKWKTIADDIEGRPSLTCRNRWRKIVTDVVRGKASAAVKEEVDMITKGENGAKSDLNEIKYEDIVKYDIAGSSEDIHSNLRNETQQLYMPQASTTQNRSQLPIQSGQQHIQSHLSQQQGQTHSNYSQQKARTYENMQASVPKLVKKPVQSEIEWKYTMANPGQTRTAPGSGANSNGEVFHEGPIANQELVQYLIGYAKSNGLNVTVHQHIHHHYLSPTTTTHHHHQNQQQSQNSQSTLSQQQDQSFGSYKQSSQQIQHPNQQQQMPKSQQGLYSPLPTINDTSTGFYIEPETQVNRYQHFNYLPPLTEVPKLNSSASSPNSSSKDGQMHHHHHHHHYQLPKPPPQHATGSNSKESDLFRLLNGRSQNNSPQPLQRGTSPVPLNPLTPLTQAVELAVEVEENGNKRSHSQRKQEQLKEVEIRQAMQNQQEGKVHQSSPKRHKFEDDDEEGMDFWETMRNLTTRQSSEQKSVTPSVQETSSSNNNNINNSNNNNISNNNNNNVNINSNNNSAKSTAVADRKPVSQHHPLHHIPSGSTPMPAEEDIDLDAYGLFYNVYTREGSAPITNNEQSTFDSLNGFGMIPFNPS
ncbi:hypothetical protein CLIB1423_29S01024 [[Candida] railenensis]|uniref:Uncharacterized protein n=1 Tax=[Candida] railenensis TaxID=45579 RepID=A0A9P0QWG3_9ASCO|nr:hypothetical protein CLIB1423_29S01024 [[Candida] railenensis]